MMTMIMISGEGDDKDNRELKQLLLLLLRRRRQQQLQKTIGLMIKTARASRFSVQFFDVQFRSKKSSIKRLFQPMVGPISAVGPNQP